MPAPLYTVTLNPRSALFETRCHIFNGEAIPLVKPTPVITSLGAEQDVSVYQIDIPRLSATQRDRLVQFVAEKFGVAPKQIQEQIETSGFPIREADVIVAYSARAFM